MADIVKAQKLAAARKKLKEYQKIQTNKKVDKKDGQENVDFSHKTVTARSSENPTPVDSMASSTHSTLFDTTTTVIQDNLQNVECNTENAIIHAIVDNNAPVDNSNNANFFNNALFQLNENNHLLSNYFDTVPHESNTNSLDAFSKNVVTALAENVENKSDFHNYNKQQNIESADPFDLPENNIVPTNEHLFTNQDNQLLPFVITPELEIKSTEKQNQNMVETKPEIELLQSSECALEYDVPLKQNENQIFSNTESLRQLSSQLNSLIETEISQNVTGSSQLELRNQELAALLKNEQIKTEQLNLQLREYMTRIAQLEAEAQQMKNEYDLKISRETGPLQEQLQYHVQTVGILVGEKTELTMALNQSQITAKQKTSECEELQSRLKASRHRVVELEKELNFLKSNKENFDKHEQENTREFERLRLEFNLLKDQFQEASEESSELKEKLNTKIHECLSMQQEIQDKNSQLSLLQLKIQQLTSGENIQIESQLEMLNQQKISLEQQIGELSQTVKVVTSERDQASQQYQQYVQQLNGQIQSLAEKIEAKNNENETLSKREQSLVKHISDLEKHLQQLQNERQIHPPVKTENEDVKKLEETIQNLQSEKSELEDKFKEESEKINQYEVQIQDKDNLIIELESKIEQLKDQPDATKLLAAMESDKVAASRAVEQNKKLKEQLEELHEGFIKMSNNKLELTEKLLSEEHQCKELAEKLTESKTAVEHLHSVIATKDKELLEVQNASTELEKQILQQNQMLDRLRHYEAQGSASSFLQHELQQARVELEALKSENQLLQIKLLEQSEKSDIIEQTENTSVDHTDSEQFSLLLKQKIEKLEQSNAELQNIINVENSLDHEMYLDKEKAMEKLEDRFKQTMIEVADLTEEKQRLEHLVLQLQSETETIGEYVTLYQCQRAMLKEKTIEKDEQLKRLSNDREEMRLKLEELNALVQKLVVEKGIISKEILHHSLLKNEVICDVHKKEDVITNIKQEHDDKLLNGTNIENNNENFGTAGKIIALLSEIKTSNLVQPGDNIQNFHPCPWCSGQLITV